MVVERSQPCPGVRRYIPHCVQSTNYVLLEIMPDVNTMAGVQQTQQTPAHHVM